MGLSTERQAVARFGPQAIDGLQTPHPNTQEFLVKIQIPLGIATVESYQFFSPKKEMNSPIAFPSYSKLRLEKTKFLQNGIILFFLIIKIIHVLCRKTGK